MTMKGAIQSSLRFSHPQYHLLSNHNTFAIPLLFSQSHRRILWMDSLEQQILFVSTRRSAYLREYLFRHFDMTMKGAIQSSLRFSHPQYHLWSNHNTFEIPLLFSQSHRRILYRNTLV